MEQARSSKRKGVLGFDPLAAVDGVKRAGTVTVAGAKATRYTGTIDLDAVMDQYERLSQTLPTQGAAAAVPQGRLTPAQRAQVKRTFGRPRFEAAVADDDTVRRLVVTTAVHDPGGEPGRRGRHHRRSHGVPGRVQRRRQGRHDHAPGGHAADRGLRPRAAAHPRKR